MVKVEAICPLVLGTGCDTPNVCQEMLEVTERKRSGKGGDGRNKQVVDKVREYLHELVCRVDTVITSLCCDVFMRDYKAMNDPNFHATRSKLRSDQYLSNQIIQGFGEKVNVLRGVTFWQG